jgi:hypothetical protein
LLIQKYRLFLRLLSPIPSNLSATDHKYRRNCTPIIPTRTVAKLSSQNAICSLIATEFKQQTRIQKEKRKHSNRRLPQPWRNNGSDRQKRIREQKERWIGFCERFGDVKLSVGKGTNTRIDKLSLNLRVKKHKLFERGE